MPRGRPRKDQSHVPVVAPTQAPQLSLGYQQLTDLTAIAVLSVPPGAGFAVIQAEGAAVRWRDDGGEPTASVGMRTTAGSELRYDGDPNALKFIQEGSGAKLNVSYYVSSTATKR